MSLKAPLTHVPLSWPTRAAFRSRPFRAAPIVACLLLGLSCAFSVLPTMGQTRSDRARGLLIGSLIGDAAGAPTEFAEPDRGQHTTQAHALSEGDLAALASMFVIPRSGRDAEPYGPWSDRAATLTDDSRFKIIFFDHLERSGAVSRLGFAEEIIRWERSSELASAWLEQFGLAARWVLGDSTAGRPPERAWGGIATMAGQMPFLPIALLAESPEEAYRLTWAINFLDNGFGKDLTAGLVAGLNHALEPGATWESVERVMRDTDPFGFGEVPWVPRRLDLWLDTAARTAEEAEGSPSRLYELLELRSEAVTWWESWVPLLVTFSTARITGGNPLATLQVIQEFGHDTDSYLQLAGAFLGALHGVQVFPTELREQVAVSLEADYGDSVDRWLRLAREAGSDSHRN